MRQPGRIARTFILATCAAVALTATSAGGAGIAVLPGNPATPDNLSSQQWNLEMIGAFQAQTITGGSPDVRVALIDSGIDPGHPEFAGRIDTANSVSCITGTPVKDPTGTLWRDNVGHGTHVAGIIAAGDNDFGTVGVAPNIQLLIVKVTDPGLPITPQAAACAFKYVSQQNVDVANASFAVDKGATGSADPLDFFCASDPADAAAIQVVGGAVKSALRSGTTIVASAGNNGVDMTQPAAGSSCVRMPVQLPGVIGVASEGRNGGPVLATPPGPSNFGFGAIDLVAPGGDPAQGGVPGRADPLDVPVVHSDSAHRDAERRRRASGRDVSLQRGHLDGGRGRERRRRSRRKPVREAEGVRLPEAAEAAVALRRCSTRPRRPSRARRIRAASERTTTTGSSVSARSTRTPR